MNETIRPAKISGVVNSYELEPLNSRKKTGGIGFLKDQLQEKTTGDAPEKEAQENGKDDSGNDPEAPKVTNPAVDSDGDKTDSAAVVIEENEKESADPDSPN